MGERPTSEELARWCDDEVVFWCETHGDYQEEDRCWATIDEPDEWGPCRPSPCPARRTYRVEFWVDQTGARFTPLHGSNGISSDPGEVIDRSPRCRYDADGVLVWGSAWSRRHADARGREWALQYTPDDVRPHQFT